MSAKVLKLHYKNIDHETIQGPKFWWKLKVIKNLKMLISFPTEQF